MIDLLLHSSSAFHGAAKDLTPFFVCGSEAHGIRSYSRKLKAFLLRIFRETTSMRLPEQQGSYQD